MSRGETDIQSAASLFAFLYGASLVGAATGFAGRRPRGGRKDGRIGRKQHGFLSDRGGLRYRRSSPESASRDRGKGLTPAPGQRVRTGGAGTAHSRSAAGADQRTPAAASDLSAAAAEFSGLVFTAAIADGRAHAPRGIVLTEAKVKRDRFRAAPQNGRRRKAFSPFKDLHSAERKRKRTPLPTGEVRPSEHDNDF